MRRAAVEAAHDLVAHVDRMAENWAEMAPTENMSAEEYERAQKARNRVLWAPLHLKAYQLDELLPPRRRGTWWYRLRSRLSR